MKRYKRIFKYLSYKKLIFYIIIYFIIYYKFTILKYYFYIKECMSKKLPLTLNIPRQFKILS